MENTYLYENWYWDSLPIKHLRVIAFGDGYLESYKKRALQEIKKRTNKLKISDVH
jgi:hypothetical protein|tara:strand:- start:370 stop:534 length:165 start_codon:yes stop_codon:yes gene_type:complete